VEIKDQLIARLEYEANSLRQELEEETTRLKQEKEQTV